MIRFAAMLALIFAAPALADEPLQAENGTLITLFRADAAVKTVRNTITRSCVESVQKAEVGGVKAAAIINLALEQAAVAHTCRGGLELVDVMPTTIQATPRLVSVVYRITEIPAGGGGGCHGTHEPYLFNAETGKRLRLKDVADMGDKAGLQDALAFSADKLADSSGASLRELLLPYLTKDLGEQPVFADGGHIKINVRDFLWGCAAGSFHPLTVDERFIKPDIRGWLAEEAAE